MQAFSSWFLLSLACFVLPCFIVLIILCSLASLFSCVCSLALSVVISWSSFLHYLNSFGRLPLKINLLTPAFSSWFVLSLACFITCLLRPILFSGCLPLKMNLLTPANLLLLVMQAFSWFTLSLPFIICIYHLLQSSLVLLLCSCLLSLLSFSWFSLFILLAHLVACFRKWIY